MTIAVTGASGYIGRAFLRCLQAQGLDSMAFGRSAPGDGQQHRWVISNDGMPASGHLLKGCRCVVHLAGRAHTRQAFAGGRDLFAEANADLAVKAAAAALQGGVERFVFVSSLAVHGSWSPDPVHAGSAICPDTAYGTSKWKAEDALRSLCAGTAMQLCVVRPPMVYGPACPGNLGRLVRLVRRGLPLPFGSVRATRSFVHVDHLATFLARCATDRQVDSVYVTGDGSDWNLPDLLMDIAQAAGATRARLIACPPGLLRAAASLAGLRREMISLTRPMVIRDRAPSMPSAAGTARALLAAAVATF